MRTTRCFDFTRGTVGSAGEGLPKWVDSCGSWVAVRQGGARVPCYRGVGGHIILRVPFSRNGGGMQLNEYSVTLQLRLSRVSPPTPEHNPWHGPPAPSSAAGNVVHLLATVGWEGSPRDEHDDLSLLHADRSGRLLAAGAHPSWNSSGGSSSGGRLSAHSWHCVTVCVDNLRGRVSTYMDGVRVSDNAKAPKASRDGQFAIKRQLALFYPQDEAAAAAMQQHQQVAAQQQMQLQQQMQMLQMR